MTIASGFMDDGTLEPRGFEMPSSLHGRSSQKEPRLSYRSADYGHEENAQGITREYVNNGTVDALYTMGSYTAGGTY